MPHLCGLRHETIAPECWGTGGLAQVNRRLLIVSHFFSTHRGGVEIVAGELAAELAAHHAFDVTWIASDVDELPRNDALAVRYVPVPAWNITEARLGIPFPFWGPSAMITLWRAVAASDVVHIHDSLYMGSVLAFLIAKLRRIPLVVTQHTGVNNDSLLRIALPILNRSIGRLVVSRAERAVFISRAVESYFGSFCKYKNAPRYIANGVDGAIFREVDANARRELRSALGVAGEQLVFIFVGRFVEKKGLPVLRDLVRAFPEVLWIFAGHGAIDPERWQLRNLRVIRGARGASLASLYAAADLLLLPSKGEGFPLVVQESMACGTPVMVGEDTAAGCPEARATMFVEKVGAGDTAARWIRRLAELRDQAERLSERRTAVAAFARQHWSWRTTGAAYGELLNSILAAGRR
jgi:glycosyltransferase involved in cell wall biosynthesis